MQALGLISLIFVIAITVWWVTSNKLVGDSEDQNVATYNEILNSAHEAANSIER